MRLLLVLFVAGVNLFATALTGTFKAPDGSSMSGTLYMSISQQTALSSAGGCGGPVEVVPTYQVQIKVIAGAMQGSPNLYGNDCLLPQETYYNVQFKDTSGNLLMTDRWQLSGSSVDVGTIVSVVITGTTGYLGGVGVVQTVPTGNQTITQPPGTSLSVNAFTVSSALAAPGILCSTLSGQCVFSAVSAFTNGIGTGATSNSVLYIGTGGNFYLRPYSGSVSCSGVADGWFAMKTSVSPPKLVGCFGGAVYSVPMVVGQ